MTGTFAMLGVVGLAIFFIATNGHSILAFLAERKRKKQFQDFEKVISGEESDPEKAEMYFSGELKLSHEVYVLIPEAIQSSERIERFELPISLELQSSELGEIVRGFTTDDTCGFDVHLNDFVGGVDLLRRMLVDLQSPAGTLIEYDGGDLLVYDE
ncbi:MAG: hypothetical protein AB8B55_19490 [Mariniblastus sp.]